MSNDASSQSDTDAATESASETSEKTDSASETSEKTDSASETSEKTGSASETSEKTTQAVASASESDTSTAEETQSESATDPVGRRVSSGYTGSNESTLTGDRTASSDRAESRSRTASSENTRGAASNDDTDNESGDTVVSETSVETNRWRGVIALSLVPVGLGVLLNHPPLVLAGIVGVGYGGYARADTAPTPEVRVEREVSATNPDPGDEVTVTVRIVNEGQLLPDLRVIDGVPSALATEDPARLGTALRPGRSASFSYTVTAVRGEHDWDPVQVVARNASGSRETDRRVACQTTMRCHPELDATSSLPLRGLTAQFSGRVPTDVGGSGLEFHSTREYRHGDPVRRIDWSRLARTGELSTLNFREERAATVVLVIDSRAKAYRAHDSEAPNAVERSVDAAAEAFSALTDAGDRVGLAAFGPGECWVSPDSGPDHRAVVRRTLASHPAFAPTPSDEQFLPTTWVAAFRRRLPDDAQLIFFSPVTDEYAVSVARRLDAYGHPVTTISPDPTASDTPGHRLARIRRANRLSTLRAAGIRVVDWTDDELATELERAARRWSA